MKYYLLITTMLFSYSIQAEWSVIDQVDDFTDEELKAVVYEDTNVRLQFNKDTYQVISTEVKDRVGLFLYVTSKRGLFEPNSTMELRVDKRKLYKYSEGLENLIPQNYVWSPSTISVLLLGSFNGTGERKTCGITGEILHGNELKGRYYVSKMGRQSFSINLEGAAGAFQQLFAKELSGCPNSLAALNAEYMAEKEAARAVDEAREAREVERKAREVEWKASLPRRECDQARQHLRDLKGIGVTDRTQYEKVETQIAKCNEDGN